MNQSGQKLSTRQTIDVAVSRQKANRFAEAEAVYHAILKPQPDHFDALQLSGLLHYQLGNYSLAVDLMAKALSINSQIVTVQTNLGVVYS